MQAAPGYRLGLTGLTLFLFVMPLVTTVVLILAGVRGWASRERILLLVCGSLAFFGACLHRYALVNLIWATPAQLVVVAWGVGKAREAGAPRWSRHVVTGLAVLLVASAVSYAAGIMKLADRAGMIRVHGRAGELWTVPGSPEGALQPVIDAIEANVPVDGPLFCPGYNNSLLGFFTLRRNPTRFNWYAQPPIHTPEQAEEVIATLDALPEVHVLVSLPLTPGDLVSDHVRRHYHSVWVGRSHALFASPAR